eukprot:PhF_6_TR14078/c0_g1_i1/m.22485/K13341/PEX7, PTS2R; peroxin-7
MPSYLMHPRVGGYSVKFNPWEGSSIALASAENFGVSGYGVVYFLRADPAGRGLLLEGLVPCSDGCFDITFSENDPNLCVAGTGDGIKVIQRQQCQVVQTLVEHQAEVYGVMWNPTTKDCFASGSWDQTVKIWPAGMPASTITYREHAKEVYEVNWNPREPSVLASCSGDGTFKLWDVRNPSGSTVTVPGHNGEIILSLDWNKYDSNILFTSSVDRSVKFWDIRKIQREVGVLRGHEAAVRRVRCSPHSRNLLVSSGYDFRMCVWDLDRPQRPLLQRYDHHKEFVVGVDWSLMEPNLVATCAWDGLMFLVQLGQPPTATHMASPQQLPPVRVPPRSTPVPPGRGRAGGGCPVGMRPGGMMPAPPLPGMPPPPLPPPMR